MASTQDEAGDAYDRIVKSLDIGERLCDPIEVREDEHIRIVEEEDGDKLNACYPAEWDDDD